MSEWNWLEWMHHTSRDMSIHTATSYQEVMSILLNASNVLAEAWDEGFATGYDHGKKGAGPSAPKPLNPYKQVAS